MAVPPDQFDRIRGRVNVRLLGTKLVVIAGVGTVGSQLARELANTGVGHLRLIDHDVLERHNLPRHALTADYVGSNKARAMALYLEKNVATLHVEPIPRKIDRLIFDNELDQLLNDADLIVATTDDRDAQRCLARRALSLDIPAVLPALYREGGGEVFVQFSPLDPCFFCWDGFRPDNEQLRGVRAVNADALPVISLAVQLSLEVLDPSAGDFLDVPPNDPRPRQLFVHQPIAALGIATVQRRENCPSCAVGPPTGALSGTSPARRVTAPVAVGRGVRDFVGAFWLAIPIIIVGVVLLLVHRHRADEERSFIASLPADVKPCRSDRDDARPKGTDFQVLCQGVKYFKAPDEKALSKAWEAEVVGVPGGRPCPGYSDKGILNWTVDGRPGSGSVACFPTVLKWCDVSTNVVGRVTTDMSRSIDDWRRVLDFAPRPLEGYVMTDGLCGNMADVKPAADKPSGGSVTVPPTGTTPQSSRTASDPNDSVASRSVDACPQTTPQTTPTSSLCVARTVHIPDGRRIFELAADRHGAWGLTGYRSNPRLFNIRRTGAVSSSALPGRPQDVATGLGAVWVLDEDGTVTQINSQTGAPTGTQLTAVRTPDSVHYFAVGEGAVWVLRRDYPSDAGQLFRLDPSTGRVTDTYTVSCPESVSVGEGAVFIIRTCSGDSELEGITRIDPRTGATTFRRLDLFGRNDTTVGLGSVWIVKGGSGTLLRLAANTLQPQAQIETRFGGHPTILGESLWTAGSPELRRHNTRGGSRVLCVDGRSQRVESDIRVGGDALDLAAGSGGLWLVNGGKILQRLENGALE